MNRCVLLPNLCRPIIADFYMSRNWSQQMVSREQAVDPFWKGWKLFTLKYLKVSFEELESDTVGRNEKELLWSPGTLKKTGLHPCTPQIYSCWSICNLIITWLFIFSRLPALSPPPPPIIHTLQDSKTWTIDLKALRDQPQFQKKHLFIASPQFLEEKDFKFANSFRVIGYYPPRNLQYPMKAFKSMIFPISQRLVGPMWTRSLKGIQVTHRQVITFIMTRKVKSNSKDPSVRTRPFLGGGNSNIF